MFEALFYFTGALSIAALTILLGRHEALGALKGEVEALKAQNTELRAQLKKETEQTKVLLNDLRAYYDQCVDRNEKKIEEAGAVVHFYNKELDRIIGEMKKATDSNDAFMKSMANDPIMRAILGKNGPR